MVSYHAALPQGIVRIALKKPKSLKPLGTLIQQGLLTMMGTAKGIL